MRDILFRAKAINRTGNERTDYKNGDWVYGLITSLNDDRFPNIPAQMTNTDGISGIEVDYNTIGQYVESVDCHNVKIFEGDVILDEVGKKHIVLFDTDRCGYYPFAHGDGCGCCERNTLWTSEMQEVIGNIYDNPELMDECVNG